MNQNSGGRYDITTIFRLLKSATSLHYLYFLKAKFCTDTIRDICNLVSLAICWRNSQFSSKTNHYHIWYDHKKIRKAWALITPRFPFDYLSNSYSQKVKYNIPAQLTPCQSYCPAFRSSSVRSLSFINIFNQVSLTSLTSNLPLRMNSVYSDLRVRSGSGLDANIEGPAFCYHKLPH